jgi:hypothetical protein
MSSLAEIPELIGFFSYSREDDDDSQGALSALRDRIQRELRGQLGRTRADFRLWQDKAAISHGALWEDEIKSAVAQSVFFIPIVTPSTIRSQHCKFEFELFLAREGELGRRDLIFPILYIRVPALEDERQWRQNEVLNVVGSRQYINWQPMRHLDVGSPEVALQVERLCQNIFNALQQPWLSPEERRKNEAVEAARRAQEKERQQKDEADARQRASDDRRRHEAEAKRTAAEETRRNTEAAEKATAAAAAAAEQQRRSAATAADGAAAAKSDATESASRAARIDGKSWSYWIIAAAGAVLGIISAMTAFTGLYGLRVGGVYLLQMSRALYVAGFFFLVVKLTAAQGFAKLLAFAVALYVLESIFSVTKMATSAGLARYISLPIDQSVEMLIEWLVVAATFLSLRDKKMMGVAVAIGAVQGLAAALIITTFPAQLANIGNGLLSYSTTALCIAYGIRRQQRPVT